jgi:putative Mn2+ efflux pump MntP
MLALMLAAVAVGLGNLGAAISVGLSGASAATRIRVGTVFGLFEAGTPLIGLLLGHGTARALDGVAGYVGGGLLIALGGWQLLQAIRARNEPPAQPTAQPTGMWRLLLTAFALSMDNLVVGFTLGTQHTPLAGAIAVFAAVSVALSLLGFELGRRLSSAVEFGVEYLAGIVLLGVGVFLAVGEL